MSVPLQSLPAPASVVGSLRPLWKSGFARLGLVVLLVLGLYAVPAFAQEAATPAAGTVIQPAQDPTSLAPVNVQPGQVAPASGAARTPLRLNIALDGAEGPAELSVAVQIVLL